MTEWNAAEYARRSGLQEAMAAEVLALLNLAGAERVLDIGCGDGKITAEVAARVPRGAVVGVDSSQDMIALASSHLRSRGPAKSWFRSGRRPPPVLPGGVRSHHLFQCAPLGVRARRGAARHTLGDEARWSGPTAPRPVR